MYIDNQMKIMDFIRHKIQLFWLIANEKFPLEIV